MWWAGNDNGFRLVVDGKRAEVMLEELAPFFVTRGNDV